MPFSLTDVSVGSTYMKGKTSSDSDAVGRVVAVLHGIGFRVRDCDGRSFMLWSDLQLVDEEAYDLADETRVDSRGIPGFPDCAFWESQGIVPLFVASWHHYHPDPMPPPPGVLTSILSAYRDEAEAKGGAFLRAWSRQATEALGYVLTRSSDPALSLRDFPSAPGSKAQVVESLIPTSGTMFETPKRPRSAVAVPDAPGRMARPSPDPRENEDELPPLEASDDEDQDWLRQQPPPAGATEDEDQDWTGQQPPPAVAEEVKEDLLAKFVTFLKAPNTIPIAVLVGWATYLTLKNYCSCP